MKKKYLIFIFAFFLIWLLPWVFVLPSGILFYFPYHADGKTQFLRIIGPHNSFISKENWVTSKQIPDICKKIFVVAEDPHFYSHHGIDFDALKFVLRHHSSNFGGSTITQQIVKNAFLSRKKSYFRKIREVSGALMLNMIMSKDAQLEWYLNLIEFGPDIYGIENASKFFFKKDIQNINFKECIQFATILPKPVELSKNLNNVPSTFFQNLYRDLVSRLASSKIFTDEEKKLFSEELKHIAAELQVFTNSITTKTPAISYHH